NSRLYRLTTKGFKAMPSASAASTSPQLSEPPKPHKNFRGHVNSWRGIAYPGAAGPGQSRPLPSGLRRGGGGTGGGLEAFRQLGDHVLIALARTGYHCSRKCH